MTCKLSIEALPASASITLSVVNMIIALLAICGNTVIFYIVYRNTNLRTRSNCCLISLAATDILVGLVLEPLFISQLLSSKAALNCNMNAARRFLTAMLTGASMSTIAVISYDRFIHLSKTVDYKKHMKKTTMAILISLSWLLPFASTFFKYIGKDELVYSGSIFAYSLIMVIIIVVSYLKIIGILKSRKKSLENKSSDAVTRQQEKRRQERQLRMQEKAAKAIATIIVCFAIFIAPISVFHGLSAITKISNKVKSSADNEKNRWMIIFYAVAMTISKANSAINPFIYYYRIPEFKDTAKKVFNSISAAPNQDEKSGENSKQTT